MTPLFFLGTTGLVYPLLASELLNQVACSNTLVGTAWDLQAEIRYSFYDCLVIGAALQAGADVLYTEDLQHGQRVRGTLRVVNPFLLTANESLSNS